MSARATLMVAAAGLRHRRSLAPIVDEELERCRQLSEDICAAELRALAQQKLSDEGGNARAAAMLAAQTPAEQRITAVRTIAVSEILFDYLDGRNERTPTGDPLVERRRCLAVFTDAVARHPLTIEGPDGPYLQALAASISAGLAQLPSLGVVAGTLRAAASRAGEAQARIHACEQLGSLQLAEWARPLGEELGMGWREYAAGAAASVLSVHALIARAAYPCRHGGEPARLDRAYLQLATLAKLLDDLIDGEQGFYGSPQELGAAVLDADARARVLVRALGARHLGAHAGLVAHYASAPGARRGPAAPVLRRLVRRHRGTVVLARTALRQRSAPPKAPTLTIEVPARASDEMVAT